MLPTFIAQALPRAPRALAAAILAAGVLAAPDLRAQTANLDVPYVPTPQTVVDRMIEMGGVTAKDYVIDLGSGDGRIAITAARKGARAMGVDLNPVRVQEAIENAKQAGVTDRVEFREANLFETDISKADVLTMYLLTSVNEKLKPVLLSTLRPGTRVVSHAFAMGDWEADETDRVDNRNIYKWIIPARVEGRWTVQDGPSTIRVDVKQRYQTIEGTATIDGRTVPISNGRLNGQEITFALDAGNGQIRSFTGRVDGNTITASGAGATWRATRAAS